MAAPDAFTVHGVPWALEFKPQNEGVAGRCHGAEYRVSIAPGQHPLEERDTVLHELGHAVLRAQGREYAGRTEELYVQAFATGFLQLFRDNPKLVQYLFKDKI